VAKLAAAVLAAGRTLLEANLLTAVFAAVAFELHFLGLLPSLATETRLFWWLEVLALATWTPPPILCKIT